MKQGFTPDQAAHLAQPYDGTGHHYVPKRAKIGKKLGPIPVPTSLVGRKLPKSASDSLFNVLKPANISRGDFYELHYKVDPEQEVSRMPAALGPAWNGKKLGLKEYGLLGRIWHGSPAPLNAVAGAAGALSLSKNQETHGDGSW